MPKAKGYKQLYFRFDRGLNRTLPRMRHLRNGRGQPYSRWEIWCGWCKREHGYSAKVTQAVAAAMHADRVEHICRVRAQGADPFG